MIDSHSTIDTNMFKNDTTGHVISTWQSHSGGTCKIKWPFLGHRKSCNVNGYLKHHNPGVEHFKTMDINRGLVLPHHFHYSGKTFH